MKKNIELNLCDYCNDKELNISQWVCLVCNKDFCSKCHYSNDNYWLKNFTWSKHLWNICIHCTKTMGNSLHKEWYKWFNKTKDYRESWTWYYIQMWWFFREHYDKFVDIAFNSALEIFVNEAKRCMSDTYDKRKQEEEIKRIEKEYQEKLQQIKLNNIQ